MTQPYVDFRNKHLNHYTSVMQTNECIPWVYLQQPFLTPTTVKEFSLNTSSFTDEKQLNSTNKIHSNEIQSKNKTINIHTVIQVILAQEKHKVARQEVTEGTYRMTKVRLETHIAAFFDHTDLRTDLAKRYIRTLSQIIQCLLESKQFEEAENHITCIINYK